MKSSFEKSQPQIAEAIAFAALGLENKEARRSILASAKQCGARGEEVFKACFDDDLAQSLSDALEEWGPSVEVSRETLMLAIEFRAGDCVRELARRGHRFASELVERPEAKTLDGFNRTTQDISAWGRACAAPNYGADRVRVARLLNALSSPELKGDYQPWEASAALAATLSPSASFKYDLSGAEGEMTLARLRLAGSLLSAGAVFEPAELPSGDMGPGAARAAPACLRAMLAEGEIGLAAQKIADSIDWRGLNEELREAGGLFGALARELARPISGWSQDRGDYAVAMARKLEELTGDKAHAKPGVFQTAFAEAGPRFRPFSMDAPSAAMIFKLMGQDDIALSELDFTWIIETSADSLEAARLKLESKKNDDQSDARALARGFEHNLISLYQQLRRGIRCDNPASEARFMESAPLLINQLCNEHGALMKNRSHEEEPALLSAFAEKAKISAASLLAGGGVQPPRRKALSV